MAMDNDKETSESKPTAALQDKVNYCDCIIATLREPFIVLDHDLRIKTANRSFYVAFRLSPEETENQLIYDLDNHQWGIPGLRELLERVLKDERPVHDFEVEHTFPTIGRKILLLNASRFESAECAPSLILLAIEDITERRRAEVALEDSELRYRRLFETAQDAILILDERQGKIFDANPFIKDMLGYSQVEIVGKELWQIGMFRDAEENKAAFRELQDKGYIRYENLPLKTKAGEQIEVEFVSNVYQVDHRKVIQCNIRDITERSRLERKAHDQAEALAELHQRKDEFLAMLSHELRNPLSAIFSALHVLRLQGNENPIQQRAMTTMERQVGQLAHLVDDLLEVSRVITGRIQLQFEHLDLRGIAEHAVASVQPSD
jgi:PAS domain S-box-containing protein